MPLKALIFDVDGTLAETEELHRLAFNDAFAASGHGWHWDRVLYRKLLKVTGGKERIRHYLDETGIDVGPDQASTIAALHADKNRRYADKVADGIALRPGVLRLLREARAANLRLAIATTTSRGNLESLLDAGLPGDGSTWFSVVVTGEDVRRKKPDPEAYLLALDRLGCRPEECIAFEDSDNGVVAAKAAALPVIVTPSIYTDHERFDRADCVVSDLGEPNEPCQPLAGWQPSRGMIDVAALQAMSVEATVG
jgi:HAD superfamily hydrolase (TIGR01509 family)